MFYLNKIASSLLLLIVLTGALPSAASANSCMEQLKKSKINPSDKDCDIRCATIFSGMKSFMCGIECDDYCRAPKRAINRPKCFSTPAWEKKVKDLTITTEELTFLPFSAEERTRVYKSLSQISKNFPVTELDGIFKARPRSPFDLFNLGSYQDKKLMLYARAFSEPDALTRVLVHELSHHLHETNLKKSFTDYQKMIRSSSLKNSSESGDSSHSTEEHFANNFESFIFEPKLLKSKNPEIYRWMSKNIKNLYNLKECDQ